MAKPTFVVFRPNADPADQATLFRTDDYQRAEARAQTLARQHRAWMRIDLGTGEIVAEVGPDGVVHLTFKGCEFA